MAEVCSVVVLGRRELSLVGDCGDLFGEDGFETTSLVGFISLDIYRFSELDAFGSLFKS